MHLQPGHNKHSIAGGDHDQQRPQWQENTEDTQLCGLFHSQKAKLSLRFHGIP